MLLGYSLGKAQEILCSLAEANLQPMLHGSVYRMTRIYEQFGQAFCPFERYDPKAVTGKVLICPPSANRSRMIQRLTNKRVAMISGWAVDPNAVYRYQVDAAFPLSDHADYDDLLRYVELVQPKARPDAARLCGGIRARSCATAASKRGPWARRTNWNLPCAECAPRNRHPLAPIEISCRANAPSEFQAFAQLGEEIAATPAKLEKIRLLSEYLRCARSGATSASRRDFPDRKAFAQTDQRTLASRMGDHLSRAARATGREQCRVAPDREQPRRRGQSHVRSARRSNHARAFLVRRIAADSSTICTKRAAPWPRPSCCEARLRNFRPVEAQYVVKILTGDLRIGLREGLVEEAIARAFDAPLDDLKEAHMLLGDIGADRAPRRAP